MLADDLPRDLPTFIARFGTTSMAAHQIAANLVSLLFMLPLALATATSTLVAQRIGARHVGDARRLARHGMAFGLVVATTVGVVVYLARGAIVGLYTADAAVAATAVALLAWVTLFHVVDAAQTLAAFVLRAWRIATAPMLIFALSLWGVGLGGGWWLAFNRGGVTPPGLLGAPGYWAASTSGLAVAAVLLMAVVWRVMRRSALPPAAATTA